MGTIAEEFADGIPKCKCGCTNIVVEKTNYFYINRDDNLDIIKEFEGEEEDYDTKITCRDCDMEIGTN